MAETASQQFGIVQIGDMRVGIPIAQLSEVFHVQEKLPLPQKSPLLCGGIELRGQLIPVLDLQQLGHLKLAMAEPLFGVILEHEKRLLAIFVDQIVGIATIATTDIERISGQTGSEPQLFHDVFKHDGHFVSLLDVAKTFALPDIYAATRHDTAAKNTRRILDP
ncbi:MAG: chemotaxis protein CheW, partial [Pseudomonadota bacterium]